jgi:peptidoglycan L-alanyl-D-glutamate endopeptidase CwlK
MLTYGKSSEKKLVGVHPSVVWVCRRALVLSSESPNPIDWSIVDGVRTPAQQQALFNSGASRTLQSAHLAGPDGLGRAIDFRIWLGQGVNPFPLKTDTPEVVREKLKRHEDVAAFFFQAADEGAIPWQWGNDWDVDGVPTGRDPDEKGMLQDMVHLQLAPQHRVAQAMARMHARIEARARGERVVS